MPTIVELGNTDKDKAVLILLAVATTVGRSPAMTHGVPVDGLALLRDAYDRMMADPNGRGEEA